MRVTLVRSREVFRATRPLIERLSDRTRGDEGGIGLLGVGLCVCIVMLILGGLSVHTAEVARVDVLDAADHASAAAADRISVDAAYRAGVGAPKLEASAVQLEAARVLASTPRPAHVTAWEVSHAAVVGSQLTITVTATVDPPAVGGALQVLGQPLTVRVTSHAQAHLASPAA